MASVFLSTGSSIGILEADETQTIFRTIPINTLKFLFGVTRKTHRLDKKRRYVYKEIT